MIPPFRPKAHMELTDPLKTRLNTGNVGERTITKRAGNFTDSLQKIPDRRTLLPLTENAHLAHY